MNAVQVSLNPQSQQDTGHLSQEQLLSALVDGEIDHEHLAALLAADDDTDAVLGKWHSYHVIGDALRGDASAARVAQAPADFLAGVRLRLQAEEAVAVLPVPLAMPARVQAPAANDAVFRWQLVAGLASLAAVMAVSWTVLSGAPAGSGGAAAQLASASTPAQAAAPAQSTTVVVNTGQGPLIRDARLEELLAEHRQNGGMSALQMPTGFIRSATYDATGR